MLSKNDIQAIEQKQKSVLALGTKKKGYTDSGFWEFLKYVYTKDEHDKVNPEKRIMGEGDVYMIIVFLYMLACDDLLIPKSRQIRMSWMSCAYAVWLAMSGKHRQIAYQTKKEDDAFAQTSKGSKDPRGGRMDFIIQTLPKWLKDPYIVSGKGNLTGKLIFSPDDFSEDGVRIPWAGSRIFGMPQGGDQPRQYTLTAFVSDESAYQDEYKQSMISVGAAVTDAQCLSVSSICAGSYFNECCLNVPQHIREKIEVGRPMIEHDGILIPGEPDMSMHKIHPAVKQALKEWGIEWPRGMRSWETNSGAWVLEVHHTADPKKDPLRDGLEWYKKAVKKTGYGGDYESTGWQVEMNINYGAGGGDPVFPFLKPGCAIFTDGVVPEKWLRDGSRFFAGYDYGAQNPSAFEVLRAAPDGTIWTAWEVHEPCVDMARHVEKIKSCPYWDKIEIIVCDPSIYAKTQQTAAGLKTLGALFEDHGLYMVPGRRGQDVTVAQRLRADEWSNPEDPKFFLTKATPHVNREYMGLKWEEYSSAAVELRRNAPEKIRQKDNHGTDAHALILDYGIDFPVFTTKRDDYGTYNYHREQMKIDNYKKEQARSGFYIP